MKNASQKIPTVEFDESSDLPMWVQLRNRMAYLITSGYYDADEKLPTVRRYAAELHIAYNTVSKAYMGLERDGYVRTVRGSGVYVNKSADELSVGEKVDNLVKAFVNSCVEEGVSYDDIPKLVAAYTRKAKHEEIDG